MNNREFSDSFSTLLNSYASEAQFGEEASKREIVLDEYEKSVYLTQAQDIIVKSYFDATLNNQGQGFDDSPRRQMDFSSLIKIAELKPTTSSTATHFDERGHIFQLPRRTGTNGTESAEVLFILNEKLIVSTTNHAGYWWRANQVKTNCNYTDAYAKTLGKYSTIAEAESDGWQYVKPSTTSRKEYVIVPISYREYDREMSKPYGQPLKRQAWRLFQNQSTGFDLDTELIPKHTINTDDATLVYRIRYVRRPQPIILEKLEDGMSIDGESKETSCELNPILHADILSKAVELAVASRAGSIPQAPQQGAVRRQRED